VPGRVARIVVIDDQRDVLDTTAMLLRGDGHDVRCVRDGDQALAEAGRWVPDVVLLDIFMPGPNGFAIARKLRMGHPEAPMLLVMASAGDLDEATLREAGEAGFDRCVDKTDAHPALCAILAHGAPQPH
jgi:CheY-like chemotaxis protein